MNLYAKARVCHLQRSDKTHDSKVSMKLQDMPLEGFGDVQE